MSVKDHGLWVPLLLPLFYSTQYIERFPFLEIYVPMFNLRSAHADGKSGYLVIYPPTSLKECPRFSLENSALPIPSYAIWIGLIPDHLWKLTVTGLRQSAYAFLKPRN